MICLHMYAKHIKKKKENHKILQKKSMSHAHFDAHK